MPDVEGDIGDEVLGLGESLNGGVDMGETVAVRGVVAVAVVAADAVRGVRGEARFMFSCLILQACM